MQSRDLRDQKTDAVVLIDETLKRIAATTHVFISVSEGSARVEAEIAAKRRMEGRALGPLDGIPFAVKDLIDVKGFRTSAGSSTTYDRAAALFDAAVVDRLRAQGMIVVGKTNLSEFAFSGLGINASFGTPIAEFNVGSARAPGGSSSGSAIALQRGVVAAALGTDTAGSIRVPAAFNGIVGFKGSQGRYEMRGVHPLAPSFDSLGPMSLTIEDCVMLDNGMRGKTVSLDGPLPAIQDLRFIVASDVLADPCVEVEVLNNVLSLAESLRLAGARVEQKPVSAFANAKRLIDELGWPGGAQAWTLLSGIVCGSRGVLVDPMIRSRLVRASHMSDSVVSVFVTRRETLMQAIRLELNGAILITPTVGHVAPLLGPLERDAELFASTNLATLSLTMPGSLLDMPGVAVPSGKGRGGLPTSVLLSAPSGDDQRLLRAALALERAIDHDYLKGVQ